MGICAPLFMVKLYHLNDIVKRPLHNMRVPRSLPTAGAVAGALYKFDGIRRYKLPMRDSLAAKAISK
jgi:hypothetical protein